MAKGKTVLLASLAALMFLGQEVAVAQKGGNSALHAATLSVKLGLPETTGLNSPVGLAAAAKNPPGEARSASSAGLAPPGHGDKPVRGASDKTSIGAVSDLEARLSQLPTCR